MIEMIKFIGVVVLGVLLFVGFNILQDSGNPCSQFYKGGDGVCSQGFTDR